jgi:regulator of RNase E activity RraB
MSDEWDYYRCRVEGDEASIFLDMGIAKSAPVPGFGEAAYVRLWMNNARPDGLSSQEEFDTLISIEDALKAETERAGTTIYVGRNTSSGRRDFFFYTKDGEVFRAAISAAMAKFGGYKAEIGLRADENWSVYFDFLYPSEKQKQVMANRDVLRVLSDEGDDGRTPRQIDHLIILRTCEQAEALVHAVSGLGFKLKHGTPFGEANGTWSVEFGKVEAPVEIDDTTVMLSKLARDHGGEYDGWGCEAAVE